MMNALIEEPGKVFGFVSTRFAGTDGVTLEARKWAEVLYLCGHQVKWFAGKLDDDLTPATLVPEAHFEDEENRYLLTQVFGKRIRTRECTTQLHAFKERLKDRLYEFIEEHHIDILVAQNCLTIPMHVPLGLAMTELVAETRIPAIAHHHDFHWERDRFAMSAIPEILSMAFPPRLWNLHHVVINSSAREQLAHRRGLNSLVIPNVLDFDKEVPTIDEYASTFRKDIGLKDDDVLILQPTRVISRKGIEHAIELVRRLNDPKYKLIVSHEAGDEGLEYQEFLVDYASSVGVDLRIISQYVCVTRQEDKSLGRCYTLEDVYLNADLVTYPSLYEGFGNAFLEAVYFRKPMLVNRYAIYIRDIEPKGFEVIEMNGYVTRQVVEETRQVLEVEDYRTAMVKKNFELAKKYYSYNILAERFAHLLTNIYGTESELE